MKQYLELNHKEFFEEMIYEYIKWGGFPLRFEFVDEASISRYKSVM